jgi:hypothetical protein
MLLWNELMPILFNLPAINFWQALGLLILGRLFFGGGIWRRSSWRYGWKERMSKMSPEEKEEFFNRMRHYQHFRHKESQGEKEAGESEKTE